MGKRTRRRYSEEFKAEAVNLVGQHGYGVAEAARRLDIDRSVLALAARPAGQARAREGGGGRCPESARTLRGSAGGPPCTAPPTTSRAQPITRKPLC